MKCNSILSLLILLLISHASLAQNVGINNPTPDASSLLDLTSANKGLLIPRVFLNHASFPNPITTPATGLLVFNTNAFVPFGKGTGFYYWDGTKWIKLETENDNWGIAGNSGTIATVNFIGTTDNVALKFRVNNQTAGSIDPINENITMGHFAASNLLAGRKNNVIIGDSALALSSLTNDVIVIGSGAASNSVSTNFQSTIIGYDAGKVNAGSLNTFLGFKSGMNNNIGSSNTFLGASSGISNTNAFANTFIGSIAGTSNTLGSDNVFVGASAGTFNITGNSNVFIGRSAGASQRGGSSNTYIGRNAGISDTSGTENTIIGKDAAFSFRNGDNNTFIGSRSAFALAQGSGITLLGEGTASNNGLSNSTAIGQLAQASISNAIVLGSITGINGATSTVNVGIGTNVPTHRLHIVGNLRMVDGLQGSGKVMVSDGLGIASWQSLTSTDVNAWGLTGNSGTNPTVNFIGTTDNAGLKFRVNNQHAGSIDPIDENITMGHFAASNLLAGRKNNVILGDSALALSSLADGVVVIGSGAASNSTSNNAGSTIIGTDAGKVTTPSGIANTFVGFAAGLNTTSGSHNTFVGKDAGKHNTFGTSNIFIGDETGLLNTSGSNNTFIGNDVGRGNTLGNNNTIIGHNSGMLNTIGRNNTFVGHFVGTGNLDGEFNVYIGSNSGTNIPSSANNNVGVGAFTLRQATVSDLVAIGDSALHSNTIGTGNTAVGTRAGSANINSTDNTFIGFKAGSVSVGSSGIGSNTAVGMNSMLANTNGFQNTAVGRSSLLSNTSGAANVAIGLSSLLNNSSGGSNTAVGTSAGSSNTIGSSNTFLGNNANVASVNLTNANAIGSRALVSSSNAMVLGSIAGVNGSTNSTNVGIGTTAPAYMLDVRGSVTFNEDGGNNDFRVEAQGNANMLLVDASDTAVKIGTNLITDELLRVGFITGHGIQIGSFEKLKDAGANLLSTNANFIPEVDNSRSLGNAANKWTTVFATNGTINTSDQRDKENIRDLEYGLSDILKLHPVRFNWKNKAYQGEKLGLIAQELKEVISEVVATQEWIPESEGNNALISKEMDRYGVYYSDLIPVLIKAIQEQQIMIEEMKLEMNDLKKVLQDLQLKH